MGALTPTSSLLWIHGKGSAKRIRSVGWLKVELLVKLVCGVVFSLSICSQLWPGCSNEWEVWVLCVHERAGRFKAGLKVRGLGAMEKRKQDNEEKEGNEVTDCFSRLYLKMSPDWFSSQKGFRSSGFPVMMAK